MGVYFPLNSSQQSLLLCVLTGFHIISTFLVISLSSVLIPGYHLLPPLHCVSSPVTLTMYKMTSPGISLVRHGVRTMQTVPIYEASMDTVNRGGAALVGTLMGVSGVAYQVGKKKTYQDIQKGLNKEK